MDEEQKKNPGQEGGGASPDIQMYLDQIAKLKKETVSRQQYDELVENNRKLLQNLVDGDYGKPEPKPAPKVDIAALRTKLYGGEYQGNDLSYMQDTLALRKAIMDEGGADPFLPLGSRISPTDNDIATAEKTAQIYQSCVDYAKGDNAAFINELARCTMDMPLPSRR